ncbi:MAG: hypothetical protein JKY65_26500 [Planctomycetes bacterium]|nr:hypothetical protein [Planctomycetota bacterium]
MDDALRSLQREADADPADATLARHYEQALRRAEEGARLKERYRLKFLCPLKFSELRATAQPRVRDCERCSRPVELTTSQAELAEAVAKGACVAFPREWTEGALVTLANDERLDSAQDAKSPCMVASDVPWLDLSPKSPARLAIEPGLGGLFSGEVLVTCPALPMRIENGELHLATGTLDVSEHLLHHVQLASGTRSVRISLADPEQIYELLEVHAPPEPLMMGIMLPSEEPEDDQTPRLA